MTFKVMTFNIGGARGKNLWPVEQILTDIAPNAALLVEVAHGGVADWLAAQLHPRTDMRTTANPTDLKGKVAWLHDLSRMHISFARPSRRVGVLRLRAGDSDITLFGIHLRKGKREEDEQRREKSLKDIVAAIEASQPGPHLILGDFNSEELGPRLLQQYTDCFAHLHPHESGLTYIGSTPGSRIDRIYASPDLIGRRRLLRCEVVAEAPRVPSPPFDHLPLWAEFA